MPFFVVLALTNLFVKVMLSVPVLMSDYPYTIMPEEQPRAGPHYDSSCCNKKVCLKKLSKDQAHEKKTNTKMS